MKQEFLNFVNELMAANKELTDKLMTNDIKAYLDILKDEKNEKPILTDNGKVILDYLQNHQDIRLWKAKDIAEQMGVSSRGVSGTMRKLVDDGFCDKIGTNPCVYSLTDKGKNFIIIKEENNEN